MMTMELAKYDALHYAEELGKAGNFS